MPVEELSDFSQDFHDEIRVEANALDALREEIFVQKMGNILEEYGEIDSMVPCSYRSSGIKIDGYNYDDELKDFALIVSHYLDEPDLQKARVTNTEINTAFERATTFLSRSLRGLHDRIEISCEAHDLASLILECKGNINTVKIILVTDGVTQKRPAEIEQIDDIEIIQTIWDIERTLNFYRTGEREKITVDFSEYCGGPLQCVVMENDDDSYTSYLGFLPGSALADMYAKWGIRLLDMNVRVFLSARGNVNKGIRETILKEPQMFCAYNNGITVFARCVDTISTENGISLVRAEDFQIVNGGQTTASLYHGRKRDRASIDNIFVPMKLTVIHRQEDEKVLVPKISEFSNTQNKVQVADLAANQAPHPEIQAVSNSIMAPDPTGGSSLSYWFYERARGSYEEQRNLTAKTPAQKRQFDVLRPKNQKFDKIKFGKVWNTYLRIPHVVSLGAQKNFGRFNEWLRDQKEGDWVPFFRKTIALLILWNCMERMVRKEKFEGYHHNIITYTLAWLFHLTKSQIDLERIWQKQSIGQPIIGTLEQLSQIVNEHIRKTTQNVTEYCKKEECWQLLKEMKPELSSNIEFEYISEGEKKEYDPNISSETETVEFCKAKGGQAWKTLSKWLRERKFLTPKARSQCFNMGRIIQRNKVPSVALSIPCMKAWKDAEIRGWNYDADTD
jgi:hypothetical protein